MMSWPESAVAVMLVWPEAAAALMLAWPEAAAALVMAWLAAADLAVAWPDAAAVLMMAWLVEAAELVVAWPEAAFDLMTAWIEGAADWVVAWPVDLAVAWPELAADLMMAWPKAAKHLALAWLGGAADRMIALAWLEAAADLMMAWPNGAANLEVAWLQAATFLAVARPEAAADLMWEWPEAAANSALAWLEAAVGSARGHCDWTREGCASHIKSHLETHCPSYFGLQIELALLSSDPYGVVFKPMLSGGTVYIYTEAISRGGNEHYDISMYFHTRFSIRSIHKYVCVIYSFLSDIFVSFHKIMSVVHGVFAPGLLALGLPVFWRLLFGGNGLRKTTGSAVDYILFLGARYVGATAWERETHALKFITSTMQRNNQLQVAASIRAATIGSAFNSDSLADKMTVRAMHVTNLQMQKDLLSVQFASASAQGPFSPQSEAHS